MLTYTFQEAARLLNITPESIRNYTGGTRFRHHFSRGATWAVGITRQLTPSDVKVLAYISHYTAAGMSLPNIARRLDAGDLEEFDWTPEAPQEVQLTTAITEELSRQSFSAGIDFDTPVINEVAMKWAGEYSYDQIDSITETTRKIVSEAVGKFISTPGMTQQQLRDMLAPTFGPVRAEIIGTTEVTRAYSQATNLYVQEMREAGYLLLRIWNTANDELVCEICGPLNGKREDQEVMINAGKKNEETIRWGEKFSDGPPVHVNCRCSTTVEFV